MSSLQTARFASEKGWQRDLSACQHATARALASSSFSPDLSQLVRRVDSPSSHTSRPQAKKGRLHEKSYPSNDEEPSFPVAKNAYESNGRRWWRLPMRGEKRGEIRPAGTISREGMRARVARQDSRCTPFCAKQNRLLSRLSPFGCYKTASKALPERRLTAWSGRRGSNPRQPAWKAGGCVITVRSLYIGLTAGFIRFICNVSGPGKRCHARFLRLSAKQVTCFFPAIWQKALRATRGRRSHCYINYT